MSNSTYYPLISALLPVHNDYDSLDRAIHSVVNQTFQDWELLLIGNCSTDKSFKTLQLSHRQDSRIRFLKATMEHGLCAAQNFGMQHAQGEYICYLNQDEEFYPDYFASINRWKDHGDVLFFQYDLVDDDLPGETIRTWKPDERFQEFFAYNISLPLGVAHHRKWFEKIGGFHELLWHEAEWDYWKRLVRAGAETLFVPVKSGLHHLHSDANRQTAQPSPQQQKILVSNWRANKPLFGDPIHPIPRKKIEKIAFLSPHCVLDFTNGAAVATYAGLKTLVEQGFSCQALCGSRMDSWEEKNLDEVLSRQGIPFQAKEKQFSQCSTTLFFTQTDNISTTVFRNASTRLNWQNEAESSAFLACCEEFLEQNTPDVVWTYGGDPVSLTIHRLAKRRDIPVVFTIHNFAYNDAEAFRNVDYVTVPTEYSKQYYWNKLGLACQVLPNVVNWKEAFVERRNPRYVTFINPMQHKGVHVFARIARELACRRPDIPLLVTQGRSSDISLSMPELELVPLASGRMRPNGVIDPIDTPTNGNAGRNLTIMPYIPDPRIFYPQLYSATKILLLPSLWEESFGLVAAEAMLNGIPVLASNRGALPDTLGKSGFLFDIPAQYTPDTRIVPTAAEVEPWLETIIRLWDDATYYKQASQTAREEAQRWHPSKMASIYQEFFSNIFHQPASPLIPKNFS